MGSEMVAAITGGKLDFGPWEQIFYGEFNGQGVNMCWSKLLGNKNQRSHSE